MGRRGAQLLLCLLPACAAELRSVGTWRDDKPRPDASASSSSDASTSPSPDGASTSDASAQPVLEPAGPYIEAERGELSGGFATGADVTASEGAYLLPPASLRADEQPGEARARYLLAIPKAGSYVLWGRIHGPDSAHNRFWFQVDGGSWYLWRISTGDVWFWDDLHDDMSYQEPLRFALDQGTHELVIANARDGVRLDRLYFTADGDTPPGNDTLCDPPHYIEVSGQCLPSCGIQPNTMCSQANCAGKPLVEAYDCNACCLM